MEFQNCLRGGVLGGVGGDGEQQVGEASPLVSEHRSLAGLGFVRGESGRREGEQVEGERTRLRAPRKLQEPHALGAPRFP